jgi:hypothetical protein
VVREAQNRRQRTYVVTEARPSMSDDIAYRQRRYLIMMGIRAACFIIAVVLFVNHLGWLTAIPLVGAIAIPYFAVARAVLAARAHRAGNRRRNRFRGPRRSRHSGRQRRASAKHLIGADKNRS